MCKKAVLFVAYGVASADAYARTIAPIVQNMAAAHPETVIACAFTSPVMRRRFCVPSDRRALGECSALDSSMQISSLYDFLHDSEGRAVPSPAEALATLRSHGVTHVAVVPLLLFPGVAYDALTAACAAYRAHFVRLILGAPLACDTDAFARALVASVPKLSDTSDDTAYLLVAHGSAGTHTARSSKGVLVSVEAVAVDPVQALVSSDFAYGDSARAEVSPSALYHDIARAVATVSARRVYVYAMHGTPSPDDIIPRLRMDGIKRVTLVPLFLTAGKHVRTDLMEDGSRSHATRLRAAGIAVTTYAHGLLESDAMRAYCLARATAVQTAFIAETPIP